MPPTNGLEIQKPGTPLRLGEPVGARAQGSNNQRVQARVFFFGCCFFHRAFFRRSKSCPKTPPLGMPPGTGPRGRRPHNAHPARVAARARALPCCRRWRKPFASARQSGRELLPTLAPVRPHRHPDCRGRWLVVGQCSMSSATMLLRVPAAVFLPAAPPLIFFFFTPLRACSLSSSVLTGPGASSPRAGQRRAGKRDTSGASRNPASRSLASGSGPSRLLRPGDGNVDAARFPTALCLPTRGSLRPAPPPA